jgi:hypothetical protein
MLKNELSHTTAFLLVQLFALIFQQLFIIQPENPGHIFHFGKLLLQCDWQKPGGTMATFSFASWVVLFT